MNEFPNWREPGDLLQPLSDYALANPTYKNFWRIKPTFSHSRWNYKAVIPAQAGIQTLAGTGRHPAAGEFEQPVTHGFPLSRE
ncbi:MAG: hypothetical protein L0H37_11250 [Nitrosospira sp.]|nr:hypothetical protein [Nitrosospira sp.]